MSERMIELQRARMLQQQPSRGPMPSHAPASAVAGGNVPQQTAVAAVQTEDQQMQRFLNRMQRRDDAQQLIVDSSSGPTVPTALSRRMLHRQGVGYLDDSVAAIASASADRFLATLLHQAVACRDQRLKGAEMAKGARRHRKRHMEQYEADTDDRKRRKEGAEKQREKANLAAISAADALKKGGSSASKKDSDGTGTTKTKKKKKVATGETKTNGNKKPAALARPDRDDDEESFDSVDEEEMFYQNYYGDPGDSEESDEEDETIRLADLRRPLEAWDFHITGKLGLDSNEAESEDEKSEDDNEDDDDSEDNNAEEEGDEINKDAALEKDDENAADDAFMPISSPPKKVKKAPPSTTPNTQAPS